MIDIAVAIVSIVLLQSMTPFWWWTGVVPFLIGFVRPISGWRAFRMGLVSAGSVWLLASIVLFLTTSHIIAGRVALMFGLGNGWLLVPVTAVAAMVTGGIAGATGQSIRSRIGGQSTKQ